MSEYTIRDATPEDLLDIVIAAKNFSKEASEKSCNIEYKKPAKFEDELEIISSISSKTKTSFTMLQIIKKNEEIISEATVQLVTVNKEGKPIKTPEILNNLLN